jgi:dTDP-4-dehydrorhamnose 3,5-epimerase
MEIIDLPLSGLKLIKPKKFIDERGFFVETYHNERYWEKEIYSDPFVQDNHSYSVKGVVRGLHYQTGQAKLVRCTSGLVWDVAVDIRKDSPTFGNYYGLYLDSKDCFQFYIPSGMAHGFIVLSDSADFEYKVTKHHEPENEGSIIWNDPDLTISWPSNMSYILSEKDKLAKTFKEYNK